MAWSVTDVVSWERTQAYRDRLQMISAALGVRRVKICAAGGEQSRRGTLEMSVAGIEGRGAASRWEYVQVSLYMIFSFD